jgi:F-type H+-transporting ATPase subunit b
VAVAPGNFGSRITRQEHWDAPVRSGVLRAPALLAGRHLSDLDERQRKIDDNLDKAAQLKAEAEAAVAAYEKALAESRAHAQSVIKETTDRLSKQAEERTRELGAKLAEQIKAGEARIAAAKVTALANVRDVAVEVAGAVLGRLVGGVVDQGNLDSAVAAALKEQGQ